MAHFGSAAYRPRHARPVVPAVEPTAMVRASARHSFWLALAAIAVIVTVRSTATKPGARRSGRHAA